MTEICTVNNCEIVNVSYVTNDTFLYVEANASLDECIIALKLEGVDVCNTTCYTQYLTLRITGTIEIGKLTASVEPIHCGERVTIMSPNVRINMKKLVGLINQRIEENINES